MKDLVLNEILHPEDEPRTLTLENPHKITTCLATKTIKTLPQDKKYKLVFDKRVIQMDSFQESVSVRAVRWNLLETRNSLISCVL